MKVSPVSRCCETRPCEDGSSNPGIQSSIVWEYGPVCLARYCLSELDTFVDRETMNHKVGAVQIAVENKDIEIITMPIFQQLLQAKWRLYGLRVNLSRFFTHFIYMILLSLSIALLPNGIPFYTSDRNASRKTYDSALRLAVEIILVAVNVMTFLREVGQGFEVGKEGEGFWIEASRGEDWTFGGIFCGCRFQNRGVERLGSDGIRIVGDSRMGVPSPIRKG
ncbi:hypothetical protein BC829DRAFT_258811 [Chytridium lagenaria]|nr:hypothetical protein BC829DRAFT_258811 [Chytridium lagenaria]